MKKNLIFIELNEINFDLIKEYKKNYNFKFFDDDFFSKLSNTKSEDIYENIEPWIQWVSIHTGLTAQEHDISRLGDIVDKNFEQIFEKIEKKGYEVGAICPMNTSNKLKNTKYFIPDPWIKNQISKNYFHNNIYKSFSEAVNNNSGNGISLKSKILILFSIFFFIRGKNLIKFIKLFFSSLKKKWFKALIFDYILHNIHINFIKKYKANFSTIFFNAGAHIQHHYLNNSLILSQEILNKNPEWYVKSGDDPILDTYIFYDNILNEYKNIKDYSILIATGLTQTPHKEITYYYRLKNYDNFFSLLKSNYKSIEGRMSRDLLVNFDSEHDCTIFTEKLEHINIINNKNIFEYDNRGKSLFVTLVYSKEVKKNFQLKIDETKNINFFNYINFVAIKNGKHDQKGFLYGSVNFTKYLPENNSHVKSIFNSINTYFE
tara:strand:+ start:3525 stop:4820 length:1296 start_codon:yes stop_codon:yes gene_type:complete